MKCTRNKTVEKNAFIVQFEDYPYEEDLTHRLWLGQRNEEQISILQELLDGALSPAEMEEMGLPKDCSASLLELEQAGIIEQNKQRWAFCKQWKKYYAVQCQRFQVDESSEPLGFSFLLQLLKTLPPELLLDWYGLSEHSNDLLSSLQEHYLNSPKNYEAHLYQLQFNHPQGKKVLQALLKAPDGELSGKEIRETFGLDRNSFEQLAIELEWNLAACLCYQKDEDQWCDVLSLFHEWKQFSKTRESIQASPLCAKSDVTRYYGDDFCFVSDLSQLTHVVQKQPLAWQSDSLQHVQELSNWLPKEKDYAGELSPYLERLINRMQMLGLCEEKNGQLVGTQAGREWQMMPLEEQVIALYRISKQSYTSSDASTLPMREKGIAEVEKALREVVLLGWIYVDDFFNSLTIPLRESPGAILKKNGRQFEYLFPEYSEAEKTFISWVIFQRLFEAGITAIGMHNNKQCFKITPLGRILLGR